MTWYNNSWNYRKAITVSNSGSVLSDYQVLITADTASLVTATKMRSDCGDIRFTSSDGSTIINYWIESGINTSSTKIWVKIPSIANGTNTIYTYYGNASATSLSNGTNTFVFFDDFSGNLSKWTITGSTQINSGEAAISGNTYNANGMTSVVSIYRPAIIEWKSRVGALANIETWEGYSTQPLNYGSGLSFSRGWVGSLYRYLDGASTSAGTWTTAQTLQRIILKPTQGYTVFWNDVQKEDSSTWSTDGNKIAFQQRSTSYSLYIDDVRVRKYASPEPTTCIGGEEVSTVSWLTNWNRRKLITITGSTSSSQTDYQIKLIIHKTTGTDTSTDIYLGTNVKDDFNDLRFTYNDGTTLLNYWREYYTSGSVATIWVKIPSIPANPCTVTLYVYYDNSGASAVSDGTNTFDIFDAFSTDPQWTKTGTEIGYDATNQRIALTGLHARGSAVQRYTKNHAKGTGNWNISFDAKIDSYTSTNMNIDFIYSNNYTWINASCIGVAIIFNLPDGKIYLQKKEGGTYTSLGTITTSLTTQYHMHFWRAGNTVYLAVYSDNTHNTQIGTTLSGAITSTDSFDYFSLDSYYDGGFPTYTITGWFDNLIILKYLSPEPTTCIGGEEVSTVSWLSGWNRRKLITITGSTSYQTDFQMKLIAHKSSGTDTSTDIYLGTNIKDDFSDLRFTKNDGFTGLNYWIESYTSGSFATVWVKVPEASTSPCTSTIYIYYGNSGAYTLSNARNTFIVYDDFVTGSSEQWTMTNVTSDRTTNHRLNINGISGSTSAYLDKGTDIGNYEFLYKYMRTSGGGTGFGAGVGDTITNNFTAQNNGFAGDDHPNQANTNIMKYLYVNPIGNVAGIAAGSANTTYYVKLTKLNNVFNYIGYSDSARTSQIWGLTYTKSGAELINQRYVYGVMSAVDWGYVTTGWLTDIRIRKYSSPEPTFSLIGTEETVTCGTPSANLIVLEILSEQLSRPYPSYVDIDIISKILDSYK